MKDDATPTTPPQDSSEDDPGLASGLLIATIGLAGLFASWPLERGTSFRMGPGYLPALLSWLILGSGILMLVIATLKGRTVWPHAPVKPLVMVSLGLAFFGLTIETFGIVVATAGMVILSGAAAEKPRWGETLLLAAGLGVGCALLFVTLLGLVIKITPW
jgi:Tripartite tricarboxylate transporter TctB family